MRFDITEATCYRFVMDRGGFLMRRCCRQLSLPETLTQLSNPLLCFLSRPSRAFLRTRAHPIMITHSDTSGTMTLRRAYRSCMGLD